MFKDTIKKHLILLFTLFGLCLFSYGNSLNNGFLYDDYNYLFYDTGVKSLDSFWSVFSKPIDQAYRPVAFMATRTAFLAFKYDPMKYHIMNFVIFWIVCFLFYFILKALIKNDEVSSLASCLYAVHPINYMVINYKVGQNISLSLIFMQISVLLFLFYINKKNVIGLFLSVLFYMVGLFTYEMSIFLLLYLALILFFLQKAKLKDYVVLAPYVIVFFVYLFVRFKTSGVMNPMRIENFTIPIWNYIATISELLSWYITKLFIPTEIIFIWNAKIATEQLFLWNALFFVVLGVSVTLIFKVWKKDSNAFCLALFLVGLSTMFVLGYVYYQKVGDALIEPHWFYFPSIGFFALIAQFFVNLKHRIGRKRSLMLIGMVILALGMVNRVNNETWKDEKTYSEYWISLNPTSAAPWFAWARDYVKRHDRGLERTKYQDYETVFRLAECFRYLHYYEQADAYSALAYEMRMASKNSRSP